MKIILTFDDGFLCHYTHARPMLLDYRLNAIFFINISWINSNHYFMNAENIRVLNENFEIGNHCNQHMNLTLYGSQIIKQELLISAKWFATNKIRLPISFAYPGFATNQSVENIIRNHFMYARSGYKKIFHINDNRYNIPCAGIFGSNYTFQNFITTIENENDLDDKHFAVFCFHEIIKDTKDSWHKPGAISLDDFEKILTYLHNNKYTTITFRQLHYERQKNYL